MKLPIKLQELLAQNSEAIAATSTLIGQGLVAIDCSQIQSLTDTQLTQLFIAIPPTWDYTDRSYAVDKRRELSKK
jgi:hypothetical protein